MIQDPSVLAHKHSPNFFCTVQVASRCTNVTKRHCSRLCSSSLNLKWCRHLWQKSRVTLSSPCNTQDCNQTLFLPYDGDDLNSLFGEHQHHHYQLLNHLQEGGLQIQYILHFIQKLHSPNDNDSPITAHHPKQAHQCCQQHPNTWSRAYFGVKSLGSHQAIHKWWFCSSLDFMMIGFDWTSSDAISAQWWQSNDYYGYNIGGWGWINLKFSSSWM